MLGTAAVGALCAALPQAAIAGPDACTGVGTVTCSGNQSAGVTNPPPGTTVLNVNSLTANITPANGVPGIFFQSDGDVTLNSVLGAHQIVTTDAHGIFASTTGNGPVTVTSSGNVSTTGAFSFGVAGFGYGNGPVAVSASGSTITTNGDFSHAIDSYAAGSGAVSLTSSGNTITTHGTYADAINAIAQGGPITVMSSGDTINTTTGNYAHGILANNIGGGANAVSISSSGNHITVGGYGASAIDAVSNGTGPVTVSSTGDVISVAGVYGNGIHARTYGDGAVTVTSSGSITTTAPYAYGILARSDTGAITITSSSNISTSQSYSHAIGARSGGAGLVSVTSSGNLSTMGDFGLGIGAVNTGGGGVSVGASGNISTAGRGALGIGAATLGAGTVTVMSSANISVTGSAFGIGAGSVGGGAVDVTSTGSVTAAGTGGVGIAALATTNNITININSGNVTGGNAQSGGFLPAGAGVALAGGMNNTLNNGGTITTVDGIAGTAVLAATLPANTNFGTIDGVPIVSPGFDVTGNNTVNNTGVITGNVDLGPGVNSFNNMATGTFNMGATVNLGAGNIPGNAAVQVVLGPANTLTNAGNMSPGGFGVIQATNLTGNLVQTGTGMFLVDVNAAGQSDKITATGAATLAGTVQVHAIANSYGQQTTYTILTANGGVLGTFDGVTDDSTFLTASLSYPDAQNVLLTLMRSSFASKAQTPNQMAVATVFDTNNMGDLGIALLHQTNLADARRAFDALSGELYPSVSGVLLDQSLYMRGALLGRMRQFSYGGAPGTMASLALGGPVLAYAQPDPAKLPPDVMAADFPVKAQPQAAPHAGVTWWAQALGAWGKADSDGNAASLTRNLGGVITGVDKAFGRGWRAGIAGGYTQSRVVVSDRMSSATVDTALVGAYAGGPLGMFNVRTGAAFAWHTVDSARDVIFPGFVDHDTARYDANTAQLFAEIGYGMALRSVALEPFAGLAWASQHTDGFTETGGLSALTAASSTENVGYSTIGVRAATRIALDNGMMLIPRASVAWQYAFGDVNPTTAFTFLSGSTPFTIGGIPIARNSALVEVGTDIAFRPTFALGVSYVGQYGSGGTIDNAVKGRATWNF